WAKSPGKTAGILQCLESFVVEPTKMLRLGGRISPRALLISGCVAIAAFSFSSTLMLLDWSEAPSSWPDPVVTALPAGTPQTSLADLPPLPDSRFSWLGISGINAQVISGVPAVC